MELQKHIIPLDLVGKCVEYYNSIGTYRSASMKKADPGEALKWIDPIVREHFPLIDRFVGGNFYKHKHPYNPHTDHQQQWGKTSLNVVIPLWWESLTEPHLIVFDQTYEQAVTWTMTLPLMKDVISSSTNGQLLGYPGDYNIKQKTNQPIDKQFWEKYLSYPHKCYDSLSGKAFPFTPGTAILFDGLNIHATSKFTGEKLGLSLRYTVRN